VWYRLVKIVGTQKKPQLCLIQELMKLTLGLNRFMRRKILKFLVNLIDKTLVLTS
jgi:hypothetical protein